MALVTLVWLFLQAMNLSNHNLAVFLSPIFHVHLGKATSARYFELFAGLDFATLLIGVGQAFVASSYSSEFTDVAPAYLYCPPLTVRRSRSRSHCGAAAGRQHAAKCARRRRCRTAQMNALSMRLELTQRACVVTGATQCHREQPTLR